MKKIPWVLVSLLFLALLSGCRNEDVGRLHRSELPWATPLEWEKTMPIAPGMQY